MMFEVQLVDASIYVFRAWHSVPPTMQDRDGHPVNAVYGFLGFLLRWLEQARPTHAALVFDQSLTSSFRNDIYPAYKANRTLPPPELERQFVYCAALVEALGLPMLSSAVYEADDLIGSAARVLRARGARITVLTADKDLMQVLENEHDSCWDFARDTRCTRAGVREKFGVDSHQIADFLALTGDAVDNIPGVPGIGPKSAAQLLGHFGTLEALLQRAHEVPYLRMRGAAAMSARLVQHAAAARLARRLTGVFCEAEVPLEPDAYRIGIGDGERVTAVLDQLQFGPLTRSRVRDCLARRADGAQTPTQT